MQQKNDETKYTYSDYEKWDGDQRWELIDGIAYAMSPAPTVDHQTICGNLFLQIATYLKGKPCRVFSSPFDVRLNFKTNDDTVVQPDLVVICDPKKIENGKNCEGAPDMVVEILSPSTSKIDRTLKFDKYRDAGVKEYWMIDPDDRILITHLLKDGEYTSKAYNDNQQVSVSILEACTIDLSDVFPAIEPTPAEDDTIKPPPTAE